MVSIALCQLHSVFCWKLSKHTHTRALILHFTVANFQISDHTCCVDKIYIADANLEAFMRLAHEFHMVQLQQICNKKLLQQLRKQPRKKCCDALVLAYRYKSPQVARAAWSLCMRKSATKIRQHMERLDCPAVADLLIHQKQQQTRNLLPCRKMKSETLMAFQNPQDRKEQSYSDQFDVQDEFHSLLLRVQDRVFYVSLETLAYHSRVFHEMVAAANGGYVNEEQFAEVKLDDRAGEILMLLQVLHLYKDVDGKLQ